VQVARQRAELGCLDKKSPIVYGYGDNLIYFNQAPCLQVSATGGLVLWRSAAAIRVLPLEGRPAAGQLSDPYFSPHRARDIVCAARASAVRPGEDLVGR